MPRVSGLQGSPPPPHTPESVLTPSLADISLPSARSTSQLALSKSPLQAYGQRSAPTTPLNSRFYKLVAFFKSPLKFLAETWKRRATETQLSHLLKSDGSNINLKALTDLFGNLSSLKEYAFVEKKEFYDDKLNKFWAHLNQLEGSNIRRIAEELMDAVNDPQRAKTEGSNNHLTVFSENMGSQLSIEQIVHIVSTKSKDFLRFWVPKLSTKHLASIQNNDQTKFSAITEHLSPNQVIDLINLSEDRNREFVKFVRNLSRPQLKEMSVKFPDEFSNFIKSLQNKDLLALWGSEGGFPDVSIEVAPLLQAEQISYLISLRKECDTMSLKKTYNIPYHVIKEYIENLKADQIVNLKKSSPETFKAIICRLSDVQLYYLKKYFPDEFSQMAGSLELDQLDNFLTITDGYRSLAEILPKFSLGKIVNFYKKYFSKDDSYFTKSIVPAFSVEQLLDLWKSFPQVDSAAHCTLYEDFWGLYKKIIPCLSLAQIMGLQQGIPDAQFKQIVQNLSVYQLFLLKHKYPGCYSNSVEKDLHWFKGSVLWLIP